MTSMSAPGINVFYRYISAQKQNVCTRFLILYIGNEDYNFMVLDVKNGELIKILELCDIKLNIGHKSVIQICAYV